MNRNVNQIKEVKKNLEKLVHYIEEENYLLKERIEQLENHLRDQDKDINKQDNAILATGRGLHKNSRQIDKIWHFIKNLGTLYQTI